MRRRDPNDTWMGPFPTIHPEWGRTTIYTDGSAIVHGKSSGGRENDQ